MKGPTNRGSLKVTPVIVKSMETTPEFLEWLMRHALEQARAAESLGEVPVGAVVAVGGEIVARAHNLTESLKDPSAHAELLAIRSATAKAENWRLSDAVLCVTLEPCSMCAGAIKLSRIPLLVFGAPDPKAGAVGSLYDLLADPRSGPAPRVITGVLADECGSILTTFFSRRRA